MTETLSHSDFGSRAYATFLKVFGMLGKAGFGVFLIFAAIAALIATTIIGLMLAIAAVFLTLGSGRRARRPDVRDPATGELNTLEARRTADGWVIET